MRQTFLKSMLVTLFAIGMASADGHDHEIKTDGGHKCEKHEKCHHMRKQAQLVSTTDGGMIVLAGCKLMKYDKNLALKKEVELPCDNKEGMEGVKGDDMGNCHKPKADSASMKTPAKK